MSCNPLAVTVQSPVATTYTPQGVAATVFTTAAGPAATGFAVQNACCILGGLQILYGMPYNYGDSYAYGSTL